MKKVKEGMRWLLLGVALISGGAQAVIEGGRAEIRSIVLEESLRTTVPPSLALAVAKVESDFQPQTRGLRGESGVMQLSPQLAWRLYGVDRDELREPRLNIQLGIDYLEQLLGRYRQRWDLALSHYRQGFSGEQQLEVVHPASRHFVEQVLRWQQRYAEQASLWGRMQQDDGELGEGMQQQQTLDELEALFVEPFNRGDGSMYRLMRAADLKALDDFDTTIEQRRQRAGAMLDDLGRMAWQRVGE